MWQRMKLCLVDMNKPAKLLVDADDRHCSAVLTQGDGKDRKICSMAGRCLTISEAKLPSFERLLITAIWAFKRLGRYCYYLPNVQVILPDPS